ncbi:hypothetical protein [Bacillus cereus group sp. TH152-1LC]|uniref:hypothetical protein n=1 Tax=Bacillus cereus group sp. TH152-1LC TaxID=3018060 RepID=UPI0022DFA984|nr:hypothetical protein [Bacillus cereus group sp. TH152-1LC]MDA1674878.1 hypothetical protein [Bacillus cereus group sp. TH152-1LC]
MDETQKKLSEEWITFKEKWNQQFKKDLHEELNGENRLLYAVLDIREEVLSFLTLLDVTSISIRFDSYNHMDERDFSVHCFYKDKKIIIQGTHIPGDPDGDDEEQYDYYDFYSCIDSSLLNPTDNASLNPLLCSLKFFERIEQFYSKGEHFYNLSVDSTLKQ